MLMSVRTATADLEAKRLFQEGDIVGMLRHLQRLREAAASAYQNRA